MQEKLQKTQNIVKKPDIGLWTLERPLLPGSQIPGNPPEMVAQDGQFHRFGELARAPDQGTDEQPPVGDTPPVPYSQQP